ncbi:hypothetical protein A5821_002150 [Enterococcus sp. 7F3_DIV0205]|uniref:DUF3324 domain-containing protein n=1 Tax=Candidatus Enterococcus palustris TaxID=1834189 RepID=A0AAQ3WA17_9ENTE|nr:DUF916 and DUF3324 domain-containing protein [Enterococcus sp. 7F3_DIV0205]OTN82589.1 hypothetical protein A5821_002500 [Enterococcus sp. 7F3_DIV0205]
MKKNNYLYVILWAGLLLFLFPNITLAKEEENLGYTVSAVPSSKQIDPEQSYFYIQTTPGEIQQLKVNVKSTRKEPVKINIYPTNAFTGDQGTIEYTEDSKLLDETLKDPISSIVKVDTPSLTVEDYEEKELTIQLTSPKESYSGVKIGALVFELDGTEKDQPVTNKFAYRIGLITSENGDDYKDSKTLNLLDAKSTLKRGKKMVLATLQNPEPKILSNIDIQAEVREKDSKKVVKKTTAKQYNMAPNSRFEFEMDWGTSAIKGGTYLLNMTVSNGYNDWKFEKEFTITGAQAKQMNEDSGFKIITPIWIKAVTIVLLIMTGVMIFVLLKRRKKMESQWKSRKRKKRKKRKKKEVR